MKVLITGSSGMLGIALCEALAKDGHETVGIDQNRHPANFTPPRKFVKCDITDYDALARAIRGAGAEAVIHAAAFTDVDACELQPDKAESVNSLGTRYVAELAKGTEALLIYISTDFVFDGRKRAPYMEADGPNPINVYGRTKLGGERFVTEICKENFFIIRSSWIFGMGGKNFVDTILNKAQAQDKIRVVSDQFGSPTYTADLAGAIAGTLKAYKKESGLCGVYHVTNSDDCSWYKLAEHSLRLANVYDVELVPITSDESDRPAERPMTSILDNGRYKKVFGKPMRPWSAALEDYIILRRKANA